MAFERRARRLGRVELIPMIDVMTFLLVFFMLFTTFKTQTSGLDIALPKAATGVSQKASSVTITIDARGRFFLEGRLTDIGALAREMKRKLKENPDATIILRADEKVQYRYLVEAIDSVRSVGGYRLALAVEKKLE